MALVAALLVVAGLQLGPSVSATAAQAPSGVSPPDDVRRGLRYENLRRASDGPCRGRYEVLQLRRTEVVCTHGPDAPPDDRDVRQVAEAPAVEPGQVAAVPTLACQGDGTSGPRVQLVYARAAGVTDRYVQFAASFQQWAAQTDDVVNLSAQETGGTRHIRYVHDASCQPVIVRVQLTAAGDDNFTNTINELRSQGYGRSDRKYLVWMDANVYCGIAVVYPDDRAGSDNPNNGRSDIPGMVARVDNGCWGSGSGLVEVHELVHTLGSVMDTAPNATVNGHCTDDYDRMCYSDGPGVTMRVVCPSSHEHRLDCNHDDYFSTAATAGSYLATHWNTASSQFLSLTGTPTTTSTTSTTSTSTTSTSTTSTSTTSTTVPPTTTTTKPPVTTTTSTTVPPPVASQTVRFIDRAYRDLMGRPPTTAESNFWLPHLNGGYSRTSMAAGVVQTAEFRRMVVSSYYQPLLGRPPDQAGLDYLVGLVAQGHSFEVVVGILLGSDEFYAKRGGTLGNFVDALYQLVLGASPDAAGRAYFVGELANGLPRTTLAIGFLYLPGPQQNVVHYAYAKFLGRAADNYGLSFWYDQLQKGMHQEILFAWFVGSDEYLARV